MAEAKSVSRKRAVTVTAKNSATIGTVGALMIAIISKHGPEAWKAELVMAVPFLSVWAVTLGQFISERIKWFVIAFGPEEATTVKLRRQTERYKKKLIKELNSKSTSEENKAAIRKRLDEVQIADIETYDIK